jgi:hypothetical protein
LSFLAKISRHFPQYLFANGADCLKLGATASFYTLSDPLSAIIELSDVKLAKLLQTQQKNNQIITLYALDHEMIV